MNIIKNISVEGRYADIYSRQIYPASIEISGGRIAGIRKIDDCPDVIILPGLIDSHIHIESSMLTPGAFAMAAVRHGTTAVVSDPHEIANVLGMEGVQFMIDDAEKVPLKFFFGAPSCVPATSFETSGAILNSDSVAELLSRKEIKYLSEMMNFPGVIYNDDEVLKKIKAARDKGKPIDGHAPGLTGEELRKYVMAGISTDHECSTLAEAYEKISLGMKILIREGSAARNLEALKELLGTHPGKVMLCSDDLHPEMLEVRHINKIIAMLISDGFDWADVIMSATLNPKLHYNLETGMLKPGDPADFILVDDLQNMNIRQTWIDGRLVFDEGKTTFSYECGKSVNKFNSRKISVSDIQLRNTGNQVRVIKAYDGELLTGQTLWQPAVSEFLEADMVSDILKIVVKDRYNDSPPVTAFINGFGLKHGAFASSVAHDSHNIIAVGASDEDIVSAINAVVESRGGLSVCSGNEKDLLMLEIAGIMSTRSASVVAMDYQRLSDKVRSFGCPLSAPFMTLSFMALLVIPELKIGDKGLFDVNEFRQIGLYK